MLAAFDVTPSNRKVKCSVEIDAAKYHGGTYFINHQCKSSNLEIKQFLDASRQVEVDVNNKIEFRRMLFISRKTIAFNEEFTFNYEKDGTSGKKKKAFLNGKDCLCQACKGSV